METRDGGVLAVGYMQNNFFGDYEMYVLKLDANGCLTPTCDSIIVPFPYYVPSNTREEIIDNHLIVYPNPASGFVNFSMQENQSFLKDDRLIINDLSGKTIKEIFIKQQTNELFWNAENQSPGIYFYRLFSEGMLRESGKMIIQK